MTENRLIEASALGHRAGRLRRRPRVGDLLNFTSERRDNIRLPGPPVGPDLGHFYEAARQVTRLVVAFFGDRRQTSSERAPPLNQTGDVRANGFTCCLIIEPMTSRGPSHFYARSVWHASVAGGTIRSEGGVATLRDGSQLQPVLFHKSADILQTSRDISCAS